MLGEREGRVRVTGQMSRRAVASSMGKSETWKGSKSQNYQTVPRGASYLEQIKESSWSINHDSAASMIPPPTLDLWEENFQDLSVWCRKPRQDTSSVMVGDIKDFNYIVQDDELNTPDIGIQREFNFTSPASVSEDTSPCMFDGEGWGISSPLDLPQLSPVEDKSLEVSRKVNTENAQADFFVDETWGLSVGHEEEIVSSQSQDIKIIGFVNNEESRTNEKTSIVKDEVKNLNSVNYCPVLNLVPAIKSENNCPVLNLVPAIKSENRGLETILGIDTQSVNTNQQENITSLNLTNLLASSIFEIGTKSIDDENTRIHIIPNDNLVVNDLQKEIEAVGDQKSRVDKYVRTDIPILQTEKFEETVTSKLSLHTSGNKVVDLNVIQDSISRTNINFKKLPEESLMPKVVPEVVTKTLTNPSTQSLVLCTTNEDTNMKAPVVSESTPPRRNLKLNLSTLLGTDEISTPVVLEPLFKADGSFDLLDYVFDNNQAFTLDSPDVRPENILPVAAADFSSGVPIKAVSTCDETEAELVVEEVHTMDNTIGDEAETELIVEEVHMMENTIGDAAETELVVEEVHVMDNTIDDAAATELIMKPFIIGKSLEGQWRISQDEQMEQDDDFVETKLVTEKFGVHSSFKRKSTKMNRSVKSEKFEEECENSQDLKPDLPVLKIRISRNKSILPSKNRSSIKQSASKKKLPKTSNQQLAKQPRGRPAKQSLPSTSKEENLVLPTFGSRRRKSSSCSEESWTTPAKRSRLTSVDSDGDKYRELRDRNNEASRKSRQNRKARESDMKDTAKQLEKENQTLRIKAEEMERLVKKLREALLEAVMKTKGSSAKH